MRKFLVYRNVIVTTAFQEMMGVPRQLVLTAFTVVAPSLRQAGARADAAKLAAESDRGHWQDPSESLDALGVR
jgi:hypothetical protein